MPRKPPPSERVQFRSGNRQIGYTTVTLDRRTVSAIRYAESLLGYPICVGQGSYTGGKVEASGTTHNGGGAIDVRVRHLTSAQRVATVRALKRTGFAAWYRDARTGFAPHIHAVLIYCPEASASAKWQALEYRAGRDGLSARRPDPTWRPDPLVRWNYAKDQPVPLIQ